MHGTFQKLPRHLAIAVVAASVAMLAGILAWALLAPSATEPAHVVSASAPGIVFKALSAPLVAAWCYSACRRCTDRFVQRCLVAICALCLFWILDTLLKYPARDDDLVRLLWYLFYIPIIFIPLFCSYLALHLARSSVGKGFSRYQLATFLVSLSLLAMVLTNGLHHFVFAFDHADPSWGSVYEYGPGYVLVVVWVVALIAICPVALLYASRRSLRRAIAFLLVPLALIGAYALCYALRVPLAFSSSVAMMDTVFIVVTFEAALRLGLVPIQRRQREVFSRLPFELEVLDDEGALCYRTEAAEHDPSFGKGGAHRHCETVQLSSGAAVVMKDTTCLDEKTEELDAMRARLERQHALLEAEYGVDVNLRIQEELEELYDEVMNSVSRGIARAGALLEALPGEDAGGGDAPRLERGDRWKMLAEVKLLLGLCKQKGQCVVDARGQDEFAGDYLKLAMTEACANMRPLGIEYAVLLEAETLSARELLVLLDEIYAWGIAALDDGDVTVVAHVAPEQGISELRVMIECSSVARVQSRRGALAREVGEGPSETILPLGEHALSVSVALRGKGGMP